MTTKTTPEPGPKPDYVVVENHLKCQTDEGEISIDMRIPLGKLELFMDMEEIPAQKIPRYMLDNILHPEDSQKLENMLDGAKAYAIVLEFSQRVGERLGASVGESKRSTGTSESTEKPSDTTSEPSSE
jgi:hypothetical protein